MGIGDLKPAPQALLKCLLQGKGGIDIFKVILERIVRIPVLCFFSGHRRPILFNIYKMYGHDGAGYSTL